VVRSWLEPVLAPVTDSDQLTNGRCYLARGSYPRCVAVKLELIIMLLRAISGSTRVLGEFWRAHTRWCGASGAVVRCSPHALAVRCDERYVPALNAQLHSDLIDV
jgi:hypothetical protein